MVDVIKYEFVFILDSTVCDEAMKPVQPSHTETYPDKDSGTLVQINRFPENVFVESSPDDGSDADDKTDGKLFIQMKPEVSHLHFYPDNLFSSQKP